VLLQEDIQSLIFRSNDYIHIKVEKPDFLKVDKPKLQEEKKELLAIITKLNEHYHKLKFQR
jgi:hypothetical protein